MRILITGAGGFVGRALVARFASEGTVHACDLALRVPEDGIVAHRLDVTCRADVSDLMSVLRPDLVIHAAAVTRTEPEARLSVFDVNTLGTLNVLEAATQAGVPRILVASSSGVYAASPGATRYETDPLDRTNQYAASKVAAEALAACYGATAIRIGPVYGPGEAASPTRPRVSTVATLLDHLCRDAPVTVCGGTVARDWTHAADIADGFAALAAIRPQHPVYNLSAGRAVTLNDLTSEFRRHGLIVNHTDDPDRADIVQGPTEARTPLNIDRITAETGWTPHHDLRSGITALCSVLQKETE